MPVKRNLSCSQCGNDGWALWDRREPVATSDGFYLRVPSGYFGTRQIICDRCGATQQNAILGPEQEEGGGEKARAEGKSPV